jgi:large subunit ribosomal protein L21
MKYAIVESGGKQYKAVEGTSIEVDKLDAEVGAAVELDTVLLVANDGAVHVGTPTVKGATVKATVAGQVKGPKILVFRYKPDTKYRRRQGHRQQYTRLAIDEIITR